MQYTLADALADESLPHWWTERGCPDWARCDMYRDLDCPTLIFEIRHGLTERQLCARLSQRKYNAKKREERAQLTREQLAEKARRKSERSALQSRRNRVTHWRNKLAAAQAKKAAGCWLFAPREIEVSKQYLADAEAKLSEYLDRALADEFARRV